MDYLFHVSIASLSSCLCFYQSPSKSFVGNLGFDDSQIDSRNNFLGRTRLEQDSGEYLDSRTAIDSAHSSPEHCHSRITGFQHLYIFLSATGSGKTLAYALTLVQRLKASESLDNRKIARPRALIISPTRELSLQISKIFKQLIHVIKLGVQVCVKPQSVAQERKLLTKRPVDIVVSTQGRLL